MSCKCVPARLIFTFQILKKPLGRPTFTVRHSFINDIEKNIDNIDSAGSFNSWSRVVFDESRCSLSINDLSNYFESLGIAITSCLKEVKFAYKNLSLMFHLDKYNYKKPFTEEEGSTKLKYVFNAYKTLIESNFFL